MEIVISASEDVVYTVKDCKWPDLSQKKVFNLFKLQLSLRELNILTDTESIFIKSCSNYWLIYFTVCSRNIESFKTFFLFFNEFCQVNVLFNTLKRLVLAKEIHQYITKQSIDKEKLSLVGKNIDIEEKSVKVSFNLLEIQDILLFLAQFCIYIGTTIDINIQESFPNSSTRIKSTGVVEICANLQIFLQQCLIFLKFLINQPLKPFDLVILRFIKYAIKLILPDSEIEEVLLTTEELKSLEKVLFEKKNFGQKIIRTQSAPSYTNQITGIQLSRNSSSLRNRTISNGKKRKKILKTFTNLSLSLTGSPPFQREEKCKGIRWDRLNYRRAQIKVRKRRFLDFFLIGIKFTERDIALCLTNKTIEIYKNMTINELKIKENRLKSKNLSDLTELFNSLSWWSIYYILGDKTNIKKKSKFSFNEEITDRKFRLLLILNIAEELKKLRNYHLFFAIMGGLNQPSLDWIWAFVKEKYKEKFNNLNRIINSDQNYHIYSAEISKNKIWFHVPYLGIFVHILNSFENRNQTNQSNSLIYFNTYFKRYQTIKDFLSGLKYLKEEEMKVNYQKLNEIIQKQIDKVKTIGEEKLFSFSKSEKQRASIGLVTRLQNNGFM